MSKKLFVIIFLLNSSLFAGKTADLLYFGETGINNVRKPNRRSTEFRLEYKSHIQWWKIRPLLGVSVTTKKQIYACGGVSLDLYPMKNLVFAPTFAVGYYNKGRGKDLGFPLEFRSGIELAYRWDSLARLGVHVSHTSNASLARRNPGLETLMFFFAYPLKYSK